MPPNSTNATDLFEYDSSEINSAELSTQPQTTRKSPPDPKKAFQSTQPQLPLTDNCDLKNVTEFHNIVATVNLVCELDLQHIAVRVRNAEYSPKRFPGLIMRIREPKAVALIFKTGKMVCVGTKTIEQAQLATRKFARIVQKVGFEVKFVEFKIRNVVATCDVGFVVKLGELVSEHFQFANFEPEIFPGLVYRMVKPKVVLLIFVNGKIVITGAKSYAEVHEAVNNIYPTLKCFKKPEMKKSEAVDTISAGDKLDDDNSDDENFCKKGGDSDEEE